MDADKHPYRTLWTSPRIMIRTLLSKKSFWVIFALSFLGAWGAALFESVNKIGMEKSQNLDDLSNPTVAMTLVSTLLTAVFGLLVGAAIIAFFYWIIGKLFKGTGMYKDLYKGSMITSMPYFIVVPFTLIWLFGSPATYFDNEVTRSALWTVMMGLTYITAFIASVYTFVLSIVMISEVHNFSKWKAFFTMIIPTLVIVVIVIIFAVLLFSVLF
ncbi:YIP1 family protein [Kurthia sibirica]|uniref:Yip1 domain-containing protein n=1 Tax=Kurthia sibirica TaxID=202750 RepID=A0A2U3ANV2_9BACL|nr:YIP1 family protein [Kurthia sibirica]PWI26230.1 hypothetical protein DEX24_04705 [Kurthia sibirica]GEK33842.1 hypothetical protein KSI01_13750 [Kurthia sibirica]